MHGALLAGVALAAVSSIVLAGGHVSAARSAHAIANPLRPRDEQAALSIDSAVVPSRESDGLPSLTAPASASTTSAAAARSPSAVSVPSSAVPASDSPGSPPSSGAASASRSPSAVAASGNAGPSSRLSRAAALIDPAVAVPLTPNAATEPNTAPDPAGGSGGSLSAESTPLSQYVEHTIAAGETLGGIAESYGVSVATIEANNQGLSDFDVIHAGQKLRIPTTNGVLYSVRQGDTVSAISQRFGVSSSSILDVAANDLQNADAIHAGQTILVPVQVKSVTPPSRPVALTRPIVAPPSHPALSLPSHPPAAIASANHPALAAAAHAATPAAAAPKPASPAPKPAVPPPAPPPPTAVAVVSRFIWPVQGIVTQAFGVPELGYGAPHTGLDIAVPVGTPVAAAGPGTVIFAGGDPCCSFGYYIVIAHPGGLETLYGHLSRIGVGVGQAVSTGQIIGSSGDTGYSTGPHVHFQVQIGEVPVNPLRYLP